jgi:glycosyltransferase involved in cell wall biosynthesis
MDSLIHQTYKNLEFILVDDGSTDSSGEICNEYARFDARCVVFHKTNGGLSSARNYGVKNARGAYISFVDSDDYVSVTYIESLLYPMLEKGLKLSSLKRSAPFRDGVENMTLDNSEFDADSVRSQVQIIDEDSMQLKLLHQTVDCGAQARIYEKQLLLETSGQGDLFPVGECYEDFSTVYRIVHGVGRCVIVDKPLCYAYRRRTTGIIGTRKAQWKTDSAIASTRRFSDSMGKWYPDFIHAIACRCFTVLRLTYAGLENSDVVNRCRLWNEIKRFRHKASFDSKSRLRDRVAAFSAVCGEIPFRIFCRIYIMHQAEVGF